MNGAQVTKSATPSWSTSPTTRATQPNWSFMASPSHSRRIFVSSTNGLAKSALAGSSFAYRGSLRSGVQIVVHLHVGHVESLHRLRLRQPLERAIRIVLARVGGADVVGRGRIRLDRERLLIGLDRAVVLLAQLERHPEQAPGPRVPRFAGGDRLRGSSPRRPGLAPGCASRPGCPGAATVGFARNRLNQSGDRPSTATEAGGCAWARCTSGILDCHLLTAQSTSGWDERPITVSNAGMGGLDATGRSRDDAL